MRREYFILCSTALFWGSAHPIGKLVLAEVTPLQLALLRNVMAALPLVAITLATGRLQSLRRLDRRGLLLAVAAGLLGFTITPILGNLALRLIPASVNALLLNASPLFIAIAAPFLVRERLTTRLVAGTLLALAGVVLVSLGSGNTQGLESMGLLGILLSLGAALAWALYTVAGRPLMRTCDAISLSALFSLCASVVLLALVGVSDGFAEIAAASLSTKLLAAYLGFVVTTLCFTLWYYCLKRLPAARVGAFQYLVPVFAVALSNVLLHEPVTIPLATGMVCIIGGVWMAQEG